MLCALALLTGAGVQAVEQKQAVYGGDVLLWRCMQLSEKGTYNDYEGGTYYTLHFRTIDTTRVIEPDIVLCEGDTLLWRCRQVVNAGVYVDTVPSLEYPDMDSVYYQVKVSKTVADTIPNAAQVLLGETLLWRCLQIPATEEGTFYYYDSEPGAPCATFYRLKMEVGCPDPVVMPTEEITICKGDTLLWHCLQLDKPNTGEPYEYVEPNPLFPNCPGTIYKLNLTVADPATVENEASVYVGETLLWRCQQIYAAAEGTFDYYDVEPSVPCPTNYHLKLHVGCPDPEVKPTEEITVCKGDTLLWRCKTIPAIETGVYEYEDAEPNPLFPECTSTLYKLSLTVSEPAAVENEADVFVGETLLWRCQQIYAAAEGTFDYYDVEPSVPCPTNYHLKLHVGCPDPKIVNDTIVYCGHDTVLWRCEQLTKSGDYEDIIKSRIAPQCDSIIYALHLIYHKDTVGAWDTIYVHKEDFPYSLNGGAVSCPTPDEYAYWEPFTKTAYEQAHGLTACDSLMHRVRLIQRDTVTGYTCNGDTMLWRCQQAYETKVYFEPEIGVGQISGEEYTKELHYLDFTFNDAPKDSVLDLIVTADSYDWREQHLTENGTYHDTTYVVPGDKSTCIDSLFTLNLKLEPVQEIERKDTICAGDTLLWRCMQVYKTDEYNDTLRYPSGNDSIRYTLYLTVREKEVTDWDTIYVHQDQLPYNWKGEDRMPGEYEAMEYYEPLAYQQAIGEHGCDSILSRVRIILRDTTEMTSCNGEEILWRCIIADHTAIYADTVKAVGAVSKEETITELHYLDFHFYDAPKDSVLTDTISSDKLPYIWRHTTEEGVRLPIELTETGIYHDTTYYENNLSGCIDSLFTLNLRVEEVIDSIRYDTICGGEVELWRCFQADTTGWYRDTLRYAESGNDSIRFALWLEVRKDSIAPLEQVILCNGDVLLWYDEDTEQMTREITEGGHYECQTHYPKTQYQIAKEKATGKPVTGCDSVYHELVVIVLEVEKKEAKDTVCFEPKEGHNYMEYPWTTWHDTIFRIPNDPGNKTYELTDTIRYKDHNGCDSITYKMEVYVRRVEAGKDYTYSDTLCAEGGVVPTSYEWVIKDDNSRVKTIDITTAEQTHQGHFIITRHDTLYYEPTPKGLVCDSAYYTLNLHIFRPELDKNDPTKLDTMALDTTICYSDSYTWQEADGGNGKTYSIADVDPFTRVVVADRTWPYTGTECDSVTYRLRLKFYEAPSDTAVTKMRLCQGEQDVTIGNITITTDESRTYLDSIFYPGTQCVQTYNLYDVTVLKPAPVDTTAVICDGGVFKWDRLPGQELTEPKDYEAKVKYPEGCDSLVITLHLKTIVLDSAYVEPQYLCYGETYTWNINGRTYIIGATGTYRDTLKSQGGCDSIYYILNIEQRPPKGYRRDTAYICGNSGEYVWPFNNKVYSTSGTHSDTTYVGGCIDTVGILRVFIQPLKKDTTEEYTIYRSQTYEWHGQSLTEPGLYYDTEYYASGCDSAKYTLNLIVQERGYRIEEVNDIVCAGSTYEAHGKIYEINVRTQFADTLEKQEDPDTHVLYDLITKYDIDVYDTSFPEGFMNAVAVSCGLPVYVGMADSILWNYIDSKDTYAANPTSTWRYREDEGAWKDLDNSVALGGETQKVDVQCTVKNDCGEFTEQASYNVGKRGTPETYTEYDYLPVIVKYNGTLLMVDVDAICQKFGWTNGVQIKPEDVQWYEVQGRLDNLTNPDITDPKDIELNKWGYYLTPAKVSNYYALIKGQLSVEKDDCGVWARTMVVEGLSSVQLQPNVVSSNGVVTVTGLSECYVTVNDVFGSTVMQRSKVTGTFKAPSNSGTYFVTIEDSAGSYYRTLIVYP